MNATRGRTVQDIVTRLSQHKSALSSRFKVRELAVFGSFARGQQREDSDVDILVDVDPSIGIEFVDLAEEIERILGLPVDLVSKRAIKPQCWEIVSEDLIHV